MSDLSGFTDELEEELKSSEDEADAATTSVPCPHRLIYAGFCAEYAPRCDKLAIHPVSPLATLQQRFITICSCGMPMEQSTEPVAQGPDQKVKMNFLELTMTAAYREQHETALKNELLKERKLALVLDLDHTLLHTVMKHPSAGRLRLQGSARLNGHVYHPPRAVQRPGPVAVPDPRRSRGPSQSNRINHSTPDSEEAKEAAEGTSQGHNDVGDHEGDKSHSGICEKGSDASATNGEVDGTTEAGPRDDGTTKTNKRSGSWPQATSDPATCINCEDKKVNHGNSATAPGAEAGSGKLGSDTTAGKDADDALPSVVPPPDASTEHHQDLSEAQRATKRARVNEQRSPVGSEVEANEAEAEEKPAKMASSAQDSKSEPRDDHKAVPAPTASNHSRSPLPASAICAARDSSAGKPLPGRIGANVTGDNDATKTPPGEFEFPGYWTKLRPGAREMLHALQDTFRFYIFTMGDKAYAESMARLLDPEKRHFRSRIVNRSDAVGHSLPGNGPGQPQLMVKSLQQVGISGHVAAVLDDTSEVWKEDASNLLRVQRYHWFPATNNDGTPGVGPAGLAAQNTDDDPVEGALGTVSQRLREAHRRFFEWHDQAKSADCGIQTAAAGGRGPDSGNTAAGQVHRTGVDCHGNDTDSRNVPLDRNGDSGARTSGQQGRVGPLDAFTMETRNHAHVPDVRVCLRAMRREVLQGCRITFSKILDDKLKARPHQSAFWQLACSLGAQCCDDLESSSSAVSKCSSDDRKGDGPGLDNNADKGPGTGSLPDASERKEASSNSNATHVVSLSRLTDKARRAQKKGVALVSPDWLLASEVNWKKADEQQFPVPEIALHSWLHKVPAEHLQALRQLGDIAAQMQGSRLQRKAPGPEKVTKK